jgi:hypothetical protein
MTRVSHLTELQFCLFLNLTVEVCGFALIIELLMLSPSRIGILFPELTTYSMRFTGPSIQLAWT